MPGETNLWAYYDGSKVSPVFPPVELVGELGIN